MADFLCLSEIISVNFLSIWQNVKCKIYRTYHWKDLMNIFSIDNPLVITGSHTPYPVHLSIAWFWLYSNANSLVENKFTASSMTKDSPFSFYIYLVSISIHLHTNTHAHINAHINEYNFIYILYIFHGYQNVNILFNPRNGNTGKKKKTQQTNKKP